MTERNLKSSERGAIITALEQLKEASYAIEGATTDWCLLDTLHTLIEMIEPEDGVEAVALAHFAMLILEGRVEATLSALKLIRTPVITGKEKLPAGAIITVDDILPSNAEWMPQPSLN